MVIYHSAMKPIMKSTFEHVCSLRYVKYHPRKSPKCQIVGWTSIGCLNFSPKNLRATFISCHHWRDATTFRPMFLGINTFLTQYGGFLKWWYPTTIGFPTKNRSFWGVLVVALFLETPISRQPKKTTLKIFRCPWVPLLLALWCCWCCGWAVLGTETQNTHDGSMWLAYSSTFAIKIN